MRHHLQAELFAPSLVRPRARRTDPPESHAAARSMESAATTQRAKIIALLELHGPLTADEVDVVAAWRATTAGRRLKELVTLGLVERTAETRETRSGRRAATYRRTA